MDNLLPPRWRVVTVYSVNLGIFALLYLISCYLLHRIFKSFRFSDKPLLFSIVCVHSSLGILVIYNAINIDCNIRRDRSIFESTNMIFSLCTTLLGFILEFVILMGLIFDLYKWWLFIAMTTQEGVEDFNEQILNQTKKYSEIEAADHKKLEFKIKAYYTFIAIGGLVLLGAITLSIGFIITVPADNLSPEDKNIAKAINLNWVSGFTDFVTVSYLGFLIAYTTTLSILKIRLKK